MELFFKVKIYTHTHANIYILKKLSSYFSLSNIAEMSLEIDWECDVICTSWKCAAAYDSSSVLIVVFYLFWWKFCQDIIYQLLHTLFFQIIIIIICIGKEGIINGYKIN